MPLPSTHVQERLSLAYVQAVVATSGAHYNPEDQPEYGVDCTIKTVTIMANGGYNYTGHSLLCQVKSTTNLIEKDDHVIYDMEVDAYNKLASRDLKSVLLIVFRLPKDSQEWLVCTEDAMALKNCCYWTIIDGPPSLNSSKQRVKIPREQMFDPNAVQELLEHLKTNKGSLI